MFITTHTYAYVDISGNPTNTYSYDDISDNPTHTYAKIEFRSRKHLP